MSGPRNDPIKQRRLTVRETVRKAVLCVPCRHGQMRTWRRLFDGESNLSDRGRALCGEQSPEWTGNNRCVHDHEARPGRSGQATTVACMTECGGSNSLRGHNRYSESYPVGSQHSVGAPIASGGMQP